MYCSKCGTQQVDDGLFCSGCGTRFAPEAASVDSGGVAANRQAPSGSNGGAGAGKRWWKVAVLILVGVVAVGIMVPLTWHAVGVVRQQQWQARVDAAAAPAKDYDFDTAIVQLEALLDTPGAKAWVAGRLHEVRLAKTDFERKRSAVQTMSDRILDAVRSGDEIRAEQLLRVFRADPANAHLLPEGYEARLEEARQSALQRKQQQEDRTRRERETAEASLRETGEDLRRGDYTGAREALMRLASVPHVAEAAKALQQELPPRWGDGTPVMTVHDKAVSAVSWSPDGNTIAISASQDKSSYLIRVDPLTGIATGPSSSVPTQYSALDWMPDSRSFVAVTADTVRRDSHITRAYYTLFFLNQDEHEREERQQQERRDVARNMGRISIVSGSTGREGRKFTDSSYRFWAVSCAPSGKLVATSGNSIGNQSHVVEIWDIENAVLLRSLPHKYQSLAVAWSPDGKRIASGASNVLMLWDALTGSKLSEHIVHPEAIRSIAWSPDGTRLATGSADKSIRIWDGTTLNPLFLMEGHQGWVESVAWSPDGITLASASRDGSIRFWDAETGVELHALSGSQGHVGEVVSLAFSPDGRMLVSGGEDGAKIWFLPHFMRNRPMLKARALLKQGQDLARRGQLTKSISILEGLVEDEHIGAEARQHLESTKRSHNQFFAQDRMGVKGDHRQWVPPKVTLADGTILQVARMATVFDRDPVGDIGRTGGWLKQIDWSSDHRRLATISTYGLQKWDPFSRSFVDLKSAARTNDTGADIEITVIAWSPDGKKLAAGYQDGVIRVMQEDGREMRLLQKGDSSISSVAWSPDGELLAASCWRSVQVWNVASGSEAQQFSLSNINHLFWRSNEAILAVGDGKVSELDLSTRLSQARMSSSGSPCVLSPDGKWLAFVSDNVAIDVYCTATWSRKHYLREHTGKVNALAWSPDSRVLASGAGGGDPSVRDYSVRLWDVVAGRQICILEGHWYDVQAIAWSPDGKALVTGSRWSDLVAWWLPYYAPEHCEASDSD